ncbi:MAG TPA: biopolymer transporter ExbD [Thermodesulfobacteriota bacterium]
MAWKTNSGNERILSEINITPLTDVMLVLLVIFMVTTPLIMSDSFKVKLPKAVSSDAEPGRGAIVTVSERGEVALNGRTISLNALEGALREGFGQGTERTVVVRADGSTRHSVVVKVLDTARLAGAQKLSIAAEHEKGR